MASREDSNNNNDPFCPVVEGKVLPSYRETDFNYGFLNLFPSLQINFSDIYHYMVTRKRHEILAMGGESEGEIQSHRTMDRAAQHFSAGDVQDIRLKQITEDILYCTAKVMASMKKLKYIVFICFDKSKAVHGHCNCPIGLAQSCSHIGALLFALSNYNKEVATEEGGLACTSKLSKWNVPRPMTLQPKPMSDITICRSKSATNSDESCKQKMLDFDPRHSEDRKADPHFYLNKLKELKSIFPRTGMRYISMIPDDPPAHIQTVEIETEVSEEERMLEMLKFQPGRGFPMEIPEKMTAYIEERTRDQRDCQLWLELHKGRITSSRFGEVIKAGESPNSLIRDLTHGSSLNQYTRLPTAVKWGIDKEDQARNEYMELMGISGTPVTVTRTGLFILSCAPFLGASCDGLVLDKSLDTTLQKGVLEIKCPYSIDGTLVNNMEVTSIIEQHPSFFMEMGSDGPQLKRGHKHYAQVQGEMAVTGLTWCDFVVWTGASQNNIVVQRIHFDNDFVTDMFTKLKSFYFKHLC